LYVAPGSLMRLNCNAPSEVTGGLRAMVIFILVG